MSVLTDRTEGVYGIRRAFGSAVRCDPAAPAGGAAGAGAPPSGPAAAGRRGGAGAGRLGQRSPRDVLEGHRLEGSCIQFGPHPSDICLCPGRPGGMSANPPGPHRSGGRGCPGSGPNLRLPGGGGHGGHRREPRRRGLVLRPGRPAGDAHLERDQCPGRRSRRRSSGGADGGGTPGGAPDGRTGDGGGRVPSERRRPGR